ncbi:hypothetical protein [uncultured Sphingomonas sp.]|uniref:MerR family transcriptional regulator n=1 Tax=uncultured Sphingomonas sp. TaxID=158754 RepID=UPI002623503D|nr:hypothetical protein [uncultured Sphingomonas sp.]
MASMQNMINFQYRLDGKSLGDLYRGPVVLYQPVMTIGIPQPDKLFSRSDLCRLSGVTDGVASFWIKQAMLRPSPGPSGKGYHKRFDRLQVTLAAILNELQHNGVNVAGLAKFAGLVQTGIGICEGSPLRHQSIRSALYLYDYLNKFRHGEIIDVGDYETRTYRGRPRLVKISKTAESEREIAEKFANDDYATIEEILEFARVVSPETQYPIRMYTDLITELDGFDGGVTSWMIWSENTNWHLTWSADGVQGFGDIPDDLRSATYIGVGAIVARVWKIDRVLRNKMRVLERVEYLKETRPEIAEMLERRIQEDD